MRRSQDEWRAVERARRHVGSTFPDVALRACGARRSSGLRRSCASGNPQPQGCEMVPAAVMGIRDGAWPHHAAKPLAGTTDVLSLGAERGLVEAGNLSLRVAHPRKPAAPAARAPLAH